MCGIVGGVSFGRAAAPNNDDIRDAAELLARRGPDDAGVWSDDLAGLGHRRLAILDLSQAAHQPMLSRDGRYVIVYNGEIYNFREIRDQINPDECGWNSNSDTEVVIAAFEKWGVDCLTRFCGMFAFVIWDRHEKVLFAARDRMGVKPFYYHYSAKHFIFASRPRALFRLDRSLSTDIDDQALRYHLECGYIPAPHSIHRDVKKLPPAHYLLVDNKGISLRRYWDFRHITPVMSWEKRTEDDLLDELDDVISESVKARMLSDVPLGAFLSGGIDSSLVVAVMSKYSTQPVKTFTIGFDEKDYDESGHADAVAKAVGTEHFRADMRVDDLLQLLPLFKEEYDEPFFDISAIPTMAVSRLARKHVTVSLSGDGGDELFGGYHYYTIAKGLDPFFRMAAPFQKSIASIMGMMPRHQFKLLAGAMRKRNGVEAFAFARSIAKDFQGVIEPGVLARTKGMYELFLDASQYFPHGLNSAERGMRLDALFTLPDDYLQKVDIASMAFSLESREPLLDHQLVEWGMKLPLKWKLHKGQNKYLLRKLAYRYVPREILDRPKMGFRVPIELWLRDQLKEWAMDRCHDRRLFANLPLDQKRVIELLELHLSGRRNVHPLLWAILILLDFFDHDGRITMSNERFICQN